jgi:feruloyl-CoA synthase
VCADASVRRVMSSGLRTHNTANPGSSQQIRRCLLMSEPASIDGNELTDKGYINQRAALQRRAALVERLYAADPDAAVMLIE